MYKLVFLIIHSLKDGVDIGYLCTLKAVEGFGVSFWKGIRREWDIVKAILKFMVGG